MRLPLWLATLLGILPVLAGGRAAPAQGPWSEGGPGSAGVAYFDSPEGPPRAFDPPVFDPPGIASFPDPLYPPPGTYPTNTPVAVQEGFTGVPPGANPWPQISPYDHAFDQHYHKDGLWHRATSDEFQRFVIVEGMVVNYRRPSGAFIGSTDIDGNIFFQPTAQAAGFYPHRIENLRDRFDDDWDESGGLRLRLGSVNPDGSGFELSGWWGGGYDVTRLYGNPNAISSDVTTLRVDNPGLPLDTGFGLGATPPITSDANTPYDKNVSITYSTEAFGTNLTWTSSRAWDLSALKLRPTMGVRYLGLREKLSFLGRGSGVGYIVQFPPGTVPTAGSGTANIVSDFEGSFHSVARSHLLGPEIGLRLDIGGDSFKIINETKVAVAGNYEHTSLNGRGLGNGFFNPDYDQTLTFADSGHHGHVSPIIEENISFEANVFGYIPVLKKVQMLDKARLRVGYTLLWVGEIQRPTSIRYLAPERGNPQIQFDRTDWYMHAFNAGLSWEF
ncbi:MAG: hypothetical protein WD069_14940 [Planctomycetales bacterium]